MRQILFICAALIGASVTAFSSGPGQIPDEKDWLEEEFVLVKTLDGDFVEVSPEEISKAYMKLKRFKSDRAESILMNEDGSVVIYEPTFQYGKDILPYVRAPGAMSADGICRRFGFDRSTHIVYEAFENGQDERGVSLHRDGSLNSTQSSPHRVKEIVCVDTFPARK